MRWGLFARWPIRWGGGKPEAQRIYESMRDNRGERYTRADDADENKALRAMARAVAIGASYQRRGHLQRFPATATDLLPEWEKRLLDISPDPRDTPAQRRGLLEAVLAGSAAPEYDQIAAALSKALGETVSIVTATAGEVLEGADVAFTPTVRAHGVDEYGLRAGSHSVRVAWEAPDGARHLSEVTSVSLAAGQAVRVDPVPLSTVADAIAVHVYLSVASGSSALAHAATTRGEAVVLGAYPRSSDAPALHQIAVVVSAATWGDKVKRSKIHTVLGPMLPAWTDFEIVTESPFKLGVSPLGKGAF